MKKRLLMPFAMFALTLMFMVAPAIAQANPTPSTNTVNEGKGWSHFSIVDNSIMGEVTVEFVNPRGFLACFEYRSDGRTSQMISDTNNNSLITDGLYPYTCVTTSPAEFTLNAVKYVEIRMVFGGEADERFTWTRVDLNVPVTKDGCMNGGWEDMGFSNQGQCIRYVNTGVDSRVP